MFNYDVDVNKKQKDKKKNTLKLKCRTASTRALIARNATTVTVQTDWLLVCSL